MPKHRRKSKQDHESESFEKVADLHHSTDVVIDPDALSSRDFVTRDSKSKQKLPAPLLTSKRGGMKLTAPLPFSRYDGNA
jgi:hypothetical protein